MEVQEALELRELVFPAKEMQEVTLQDGEEITTVEPEVEQDQLLFGILLEPVYMYLLSKQLEDYQPGILQEEEQQEQVMLPQSTKEVSAEEGIHTKQGQETPEEVEDQLVMEV